MKRRKQMKKKIFSMILAALMIIGGYVALPQSINPFPAINVFADSRSDIPGNVYKVTSNFTSWKYKAIPADCFPAPGGGQTIVYAAIKDKLVYFKAGDIVVPKWNDKLKFYEDSITGAKISKSQLTYMMKMY